MAKEIRIPIPSQLNANEVPAKLGIPKLIEMEAHDWVAEKKHLAAFIKSRRFGDLHEIETEPPDIEWQIEGNDVVLSGSHSDSSEVDMYLQSLAWNIGGALDDWRKDLLFAEARTREARLAFLQAELLMLRESAEPNGRPETIDANPCGVETKGADSVQQWHYDEGPWTYEYELPATNISPDLTALIPPWLATFVGLFPDEVTPRLQNLWEPIRDPSVRLVADWLLQLVPRSIYVGEQGYSALIMDQPGSGNQPLPFGSSRRSVISLNSPASMEPREGTPAILAEFFQYFGGLSIGFPPGCHTFGTNLNLEQAVNYVPDSICIPDQWREFVTFLRDGCGNMSIVDDNGNMGQFNHESSTKPFSSTGRSVAQAIRDIPLRAETFHLHFRSG